MDFPLLHHSGTYHSQQTKTSPSSDQHPDQVCAIPTCDQILHQMKESVCHALSLSGIGEGEGVVTGDGEL